MCIRDRPQSAEFKQTELEEDSEPFDPFDIVATDTSEQRQVLSLDGGLHSERFRSWSDNTAQFSCDARLVKVTSSQIVLLCANGQQTGVALDRLAGSDLEFVRKQVSALRILRSREMAAEKLAVAWTREF